MLTVDDCVHFSNLNPDEIAAIAEHEHVDMAVACEMATDLSHSPSGRREMLRYLVEDIGRAEAHQDFAHARELRSTLNRFLAKNRYL